MESRHAYDHKTASPFSKMSDGKLQDEQRVVNECKYKKPVRRPAKSSNIVMDVSDP